MCSWRTGVGHSARCGSDVLVIGLTRRGNDSACAEENTVAETVRCQVTFLQMFGGFSHLQFSSLDTNEPRSVNRKSNERVSFTGRFWRCLFFIKHFIELDLFIYLHCSSWRHVETAIRPHVCNFETSSLFSGPRSFFRTMFGQEGGAEEADLIGCDWERITK